MERLEVHDALGIKSSRTSAGLGDAATPPRVQVHIHDTAMCVVAQYIQPNASGVRFACSNLCELDPVWGTTTSSPHPPLATTHVAWHSSMRFVTSVRSN